MSNIASNVLPSNLADLYQSLGGKLRLVSVILRNSPQGWMAVDTHDHFPVGVLSVSQDAYGVYVNYPAFSKNLGFSTTVDEFYATAGITGGASVGYDQAYLQFGKNGQILNPTNMSASGNVQFILICSD